MLTRIHDRGTPRTHFASECSHSCPQVLAERDGNVRPGFEGEEEVIFELGIERALLTLTQAEASFPAGPTVWKIR